MVSIQIDEQSAKALQLAANAAGISISDYVKTLVPQVNVAMSTPWDQLEREFVALSVDGTLPTTFSRCDLYADHD